MEKSKHPALEVRKDEVRGLKKKRLKGAVSDVGSFTFEGSGTSSSKEDAIGHIRPMLLL